MQMLMALVLNPQVRHQLHPEKIDSLCSVGEKQIRNALNKMQVIKKQELKPRVLYDD